MVLLMNGERILFTDPSNEWLTPRLGHHLAPVSGVQGTPVHAHRYHQCLMSMSRQDKTEKTHCPTHASKS